MHEKYAKEPVVAVSVSFDDPAEKGKKEAVRKFLESRKAAFTNLILDETAEFWQQKFQADAPPFVFVFDRAGKWTQFKGKDHYPEIDKLVAELLNEK